MTDENKIWVSVKTLGQRGNNFTMVLEKEEEFRLSITDYKGDTLFYDKLTPQKLLNLVKNG